MAAAPKANTIAEEQPGQVQAMVEPVTSENSGYTSPYGFTHLITFAPQGDFAPRKPQTLLSVLNKSLSQTEIATGYFRTRPVDRKLVGSICTNQPQELQALIEKIPQLKYVKTERLTEESFNVYEKTEQESLPAVDGGFVSPVGFTHIVATGGKGGFEPKTDTSINRALSESFKGLTVSFGVLRSRVEDGKLISLVLTDDPEGMKRVLDESPILQFIRSVRLTKPMYDEYFDDYGNSNHLPPEDGGFMNNGHRYVITIKSKGDFSPKTEQDYWDGLHSICPWAYAGRSRTKVEDRKLVLMFLTDDADIMKEVIEKSSQLEFVKAERLTEKSFNAYVQIRSESLPPVDGGFVSPGGHTHIVTFGPKGDFSPRNPIQMLSALNEKLFAMQVASGYYRSKPVDGKLIGSICTSEPEKLKECIESTEKLEFLKSERMTAESFAEHEKSNQESFPPADDGFVSPFGSFTHIVRFRPTGKFAPLNPMDYLDVFRPLLVEHGVHCGYFRTTIQNGSLLGSFLCVGPEDFEKMLESCETIEYLGAERLTEESFNAYEQTKQESLAEEKSEGLMPEQLEAKLKTIRNTEWYKKLNEMQKKYVEWDEEHFSYDYDLSGVDLANDRDGLEKKWLQLLKGPEPVRREYGKTTPLTQAIVGLAEIKSKEAKPLLVKITAEKVLKDNAYRHTATKALGQLGDPSVVPDLIPLVYHFNVNVRFDAQVALVKLTGENFGRDTEQWGKWWNANRGKFGTDMPEFDMMPVDWTCGSNDSQIKHYSDPKIQEEVDKQFLGIR